MLEDDAQVLMNAIESSVIKASENILGKRKTNDTNQWISTAIKQAIEEKKRTRQEFGTRSIQYKLKKNNIKKLCKIYQENNVEKEYKKLGSLPLNQQYYTAVKNPKLKHKRNIRGWEMKDKARKTLSNIEDILKNWTV